MSKNTRPGPNPGEKRAWLDAAASSDSDECMLWPWSRRSGYGQVQWGGTIVGTHVIVCSAVHGPRPDGLEVAHSCGNRACCNSRHLRWDTRRGNAGDMSAHGTDPSGERHPHAKLTDPEVITIRGLAAAGFTQQRIAAYFGTSYQNVSKIVRRTAWRHIAVAVTPVVNTETINQPERHNTWT